MNKISFNPVKKESSPVELKVFKRSNANDSVISNTSNPFGMTFKGKVLTSDIFESSQEKEKVSIAKKFKNANIAFCAAAAEKFNSTKKIFSDFPRIAREALDTIIITTKNANEIATKINSKIINVAQTTVNYIKHRNNPYMNGKSVEELSLVLKKNNDSLTNLSV